MIELAVRIAQIFGTNLRRLRKSQKVTQADLCRSMNISIPTLIRWEKGENMPREEGQIDTLAEILRVPPEHLFQRDDEMPPPSEVKFTPKQIVDAANELAAKGQIVLKWKIK